MTKLLLPMIALAGSLWADAPSAPSPAIPSTNPSANPVGDETGLTDAAPSNVNARYKIDQVHVKRAPGKSALKKDLQEEIDKLAGSGLDFMALDKVAAKLKDELKVSNVDIQVTKSTMPERVEVTFVTNEQEGSQIGVSTNRFLYESREGWTGGVTASYTHAGAKLSFGVLSDGDSLLERYAGYEAHIEYPARGGEPVSLSFGFLDYHEQWNGATAAAAQTGELYGTRRHFVPEVTFRLPYKIEWTAGADFAQLGAFLPNPVALGPGERSISSNAAVTTLRYGRGGGDSSKSHSYRTLSASYSLRSGTGLLDSDAIYTRQLAQAQYWVHERHHQLVARFDAGHISGDAPMYERFSVGNAGSLRGWNKFDLNPLGATRMVRGSVDYSYRGLLVFYDAGSAWNVGEDIQTRQSAGFGITVFGLEVALAFPINAAHGTPVFYAGTNF